MIDEKEFLKDVVNYLTEHGWEQGSSSGYDEKLALYTRDLMEFVQEIHPAEWQELTDIYPRKTKQAFINFIGRQLDKKGTLFCLRKVLKDRGVKFRIAQFKPGDTAVSQSNYAANRLRMVPRLVYSAHGFEELVDLALFVNGIPVATLELKADCEQAIKRYKRVHKPLDGRGNPEPLLTPKRGALLHFSVSPDAVKMTNQLAGKATHFTPFNEVDSIPNDEATHATQFLWKQTFQRDHFLNMLNSLSI